MGGTEFILLLLLFYMTVPSIFATDFKYCNKKNEYAIKVSGVVISPVPIVRSKETSFTISALTDEPLSGGKVVVNVAYFGWSVFSETGDLCATLSCPISAGDFTISYSKRLPTLAPPEVNCYLMNTGLIHSYVEDTRW
uniref:putative phosphatidylglycerol/phosphatidylinositol transfer protein DDB_G0282179 isoform X2 n=1 Tax=Erigeron canadensis TaxID=72917 RepID=UPI001CB9908A|nr:putative phosphatidylglycerol/phosphatidylinositol transfer protein DDB_G0282179 isoform X2 [Erigeron canadensis]